MNILIIIAFLFVGLFAGVMAGMLGIGGGLIFVPFQVFLFYLTDVPDELQMKLAVGTSLAATVFTTLITVFAQARKHSIWWKLVYKVIIGIVIGAISGAFLARIMPSKLLEVIFGVFSIILGIYFLFLNAHHEHTPEKTPDFAILNSLALAIGLISSMLGIGGGALVVPTLVYFRVPLRKAIGSATTIACMLSITGAITFLFPSITGDTIYEYSLGYLYLPSFIPMTIGAVLSAPFGVKLAHCIPRDVLKKIFATLLCVIGLLMIFR